ncbi:type I polyketide synthase [Acuticoccus kandeliae]|uniref:type I polyketide synthase n=1 Tax=Acuticoccus kandeliae TaxID=2073160 RepID=UPI000D3E7ABD|nr:type I polyketide synthase [Acuticoccus kandeliae]
MNIVSAHQRSAADSSQLSAVGDVAIIGCGMRLPGGVNDLEALWDFLKGRGDAIRDLPEGRWIHDLYDPKPRHGRTYVRRAGFIDGLDLIDTSFLSISPREAAQIDPQQRILIETSYEALENAGVPLEKIAKTRTGVFVGISSNDYIQYQNEEPRRGNAYTNTGGAFSIAANRISYVFDLRGPSMAIDTACSSGLTAFDYAVRSIRQGACEMAIVGAANALFKAEPFAGFCGAKMLSPVAQCRAFDADGAGFVRAEGAVAFVLKPLDKARADNDPILAVVRGTDANNDGRTGGLSLPNGDAQAELIERVFHSHGIRYDDVVYVEAHGTGTAAGDPIEAGAIARGIAQARSGDSVTPIGSIKTNVGHLEPASGLAGLAKAILCLNKRQIPPQLHFDTPNPAIDFDALRIKVVTEMMPLPQTSGPALVAINSFGFGGANAHVVIAEPPVPGPQVEHDLDRPWFMVSGRSPEALRAAAGNLSKYLDERATTPSVFELAGNLLTRRTWHSQRAAIWADSIEELRVNLDAIAADKEAPSAQVGSALATQRPVFVFTGNGPQWWGMGRELYAGSETFRDTINEIDAAFREVSDLNLIEEMMNCEESDSRMAMTEIAQPALFAIQVGIVRCLAEDGIYPGATVGHSAGELAAAYCAGLFSLETIVKIVSARSNQQGKTAGTGAMAAVGLGMEKTAEAIAHDKSLVITGDNGPDATTIAGPVAAIDTIVKKLDESGVFARKLRLNYAFHSPMMDPIEEGFRAEVRGVRGVEGDVPFYSTVSGLPQDGREMDENYWWKNLRDPVLFRPAIEEMCADGFGLFVEVGPHPNLIGYVKAVGKAAGKSVRTIETLRRGEDEVRARRKAVAAAAVAGASFDFSTMFPQPVRALDLPTYPWQHERFFNRPAPRAPLPTKMADHVFLGYQIGLAEDVWSQEMALSRVPFVGDHVIRDTVLFPAAGFFETAIAAGLTEAAPETTVELRAGLIEKALPLDDEREVLLQTFIDKVDHSLSIRSRVINAEADAEPDPFTDHLRAVLEFRPKTTPKLDLEPIKARMRNGFREATEHYHLTASRGLHYGPAFQTVDRVELGDREVLATLVRKDDVGGTFNLDPTQVDGALQAMIGLIDTGNDRRLFVPVQIDRLVYHASTREFPTVYAHVVARGANRFYLSADVTIVSPEGDVLAELIGVQVRSVGTGHGNDAVTVEQVQKPLMAFDPALVSVDPVALLANAPVTEAVARRDAIIDEYNRTSALVCGAFTADTMQTLTGGAPFTIESLVAEGKVAERHAKYARTIVRDSVKEGFIAEEGDGTYRVVSSPDPMVMWREHQPLYPQYAAEWFLTARIYLQHIPLLSGEVEVLEILFPRSGSPVMEQIYEQGFSSIGANTALAHAVREFVLQMPTTRPVRILEVGGGTGGTTAHILKALPKGRFKYIFTDVSPDFLMRVERRFNDVPGFDTAVFDVSSPKDPADLGGPFDLVIGANVIHATASIRDSLRNARGLLRDNGMIGLIELERVSYFDFFFGLLPGVWAFNDVDDRPEHALMAGAKWVEILGEEGFDSIGLKTDETATTPSNVSVLLARKNVREGESEVYTKPVEVPEGEAAEAAPEAPAPKNWVVLSYATGGSVAPKLVERIRAAGDIVHDVAVSDESGAPEGASLTIAGGDEAAWAKFCNELKGKSVDEIVVFAPDSTLPAAPHANAGWSLVAFVKASILADWSCTPRFTLVTEGVEGEKAVNLAGAAFWGIGRTIVNEQPQWKSRRIDTAREDEARAHLLEWLLAAGTGDPSVGETIDELRITSEGVLASYIEVVEDAEMEAAASGAPAKQFAVTLNAQGSIDNLLLKEVPPTASIEPGSVEIAIKSAGLNFKDIILALGMLPPELLKDSPVGPLMGLEGAGEVVRVGEGVTNVTVGDHVMVMAEGCFASHLTVPAQAVQKLPSGWSYPEAATLPVVGLTVVYALSTVARLRAGETFLVHGGAGGIGLLAIQYAKSLGAKVIATAGSPEKRDLLKALGVDCISDSRTLKFDEDVRAFTNGEGVDVVLNSLAGDAMLTTLDLLKPFGRFVEIGKRDFEANNRLNLKALEKNISYFAVDLTYLPRYRPDLFVETWQLLLEACESGAIRPLPFRTYTVAGIKEAFRLMQAGRHFGKLVIDLEQLDARPLPLPKPSVSFASEGVHLITGGLGGIGLKLAHWMAERGAKTIALVGRKGVTTEEQTAAIEGIEAAGAKVVVAQADVADGDRVKSLVEELVRDHGSIRGIMHAVLVLEDGLMSNMTEEKFVKAASPKVDGAYHLDRLTRGQPLDYFVSFSSLATLLGNPGQANYVAANAYLEKLSEARRAEGLPALALALGAVEDAGILQRDEANLNQSLGSTITVADILATLDSLLVSGEPAVATVLNPHGKLMKAPILKTARVSGVLGGGDDHSLSDADKIDFTSVPPEERAALMEHVLIETIAKIMGAKESRIDPEKSLTATGLDSLMAVEFGMAIEQRLGVSIPRSELTADRSIRDLAFVMLGRLNVEVAVSSAPASAPSVSVSELMKADATLPEDFSYKGEVAQVPLAERNAVFFTGGTGFLGSFILDELLKKGTKRIIALNRGRSQKHAEERLIAVLRRAKLDDVANEVGKKIEVWSGDFNAADFEMTPEQWKILEDEVDVIIHNGADVSFVKGYQEMREGNVLSVKRLIDLAAKKGDKAVHFVSTLRVYARLDQIEGARINEGVDPWLPPEEEGGYVQTKWSADMYATAAREKGMPIGIYRPSFVIGRTTDGFSSVSDLGSALAKFALDTRFLPDVDVALPVIPVDIAAQRIVAFIDTPGEQFATRHITDWPSLSIRDIKSISDENGYMVDLLPIDEFITRAIEFFEANPGHPALWLPAFFMSGAANNMLGTQLDEPILPSSEPEQQVYGRESLAAMVRWFQSELTDQKPVLVN